MLLFPRLFAIERVCKTILPTMKPVKRTFTAAVQAKKTVSMGIGVKKLITDGDNVEPEITLNMEKTGYLKESV